MTKRRGATIKIFLPDGSPEGLRVIERIGWSGIALTCSRAQYPDVRSRPEFERTGIYLLCTRPTSDSEQMTIYVGEADVLRDRLDQWVRTDKEWTHVIAFTSKDLNVHKTHAKNLESKLVTLGLSAKRARFENSNVPPAPQLPESEREDVEAFLDEMLVIFPLLGVRAFELPENSKLSLTNQGDRKFYIRHRDGFSAVAENRPDGFVVERGSHATKTHTPTQAESNVRLWEELRETGVLVDSDGEFLVFSQAYSFNSPSQAGGVLLGRRVAGPQIWLDSEGKSLKDIEEAAIGKGD